MSELRKGKDLPCLSYLFINELFPPQAFSRRWDMERHLNKSKYGCPANRFGNGMEGGSEAEQSPGGHSGAVVTSVTQMEAASGGQVSQVTTHGLTLTSLPHSDAALVTLLPSHINGTSH